MMAFAAKRQDNKAVRPPATFKLLISHPVFQEEITNLIHTDSILFRLVSKDFRDISAKVWEMRRASRRIPRQVTEKGYHTPASEVYANESAYNWCIRSGFGREETHVIGAIHHGKLDILKILISKNYTWPSESDMLQEVSLARSKDQYNTILWAIENGYDANKISIIGHLGRSTDLKSVVLRLAAEHVSFESITSAETVALCKGSLQEGHIDLLRALLEMGGIMTPYMYRVAAAHKQLETLTWLVENGCDPSFNAFRDAFVVGDVQRFGFMMTHLLPGDILPSTVFSWTSTCVESIIGILMLLRNTHHPIPFLYIRTQLDADKYNFTKCHGSRDDCFKLKSWLNIVEYEYFA